MLSHVSRSIGRALPGGSSGIGVDFAALNVIQTIVVPRIGNSDTPTVRQYTCPDGTKFAYVQAWGHGANNTGGGGSWAADMIEAVSGDVITTSMPSRSVVSGGQAAQAVLNGITVKAVSASGSIGGSVEDSIGRWKFAGGNAGQRGGGPSGGESGVNRAGGAAGGHLTPGGAGGPAEGVTPGGGVTGSATPGQPQIVIAFLGDPL